METIIKPRNVFSLDLKELWRYRELLYILVWRNVMVRYKQTFLGVAWVLFQPTVTTAIFSIFFGKLAKLPSEDLPYPLFAYIGLMFWTFFSNALTLSGTSIVGMSGVIKKVYFPRIIIPLSSVLTAGVDFLVSLIPLVILLIYYRILPNSAIVIFFPIGLLVVFLASSGLGMFLAALNVRYRDVTFIIPFFIQIGIFLTPVIYPLSVIFDYRKWMLMLNPLTGVIENFRYLVSGGQKFDFNLFLISFGVSLITFAFGLFVFKKTESEFADIV